MNVLKRPIQMIRLIQINFILYRNRLDSLVFSTGTFQRYSFLRYFNPWHWLNKNEKSHAESLRIALEQLGPVFIKFGQALSTRRDLLPEDIADELEKLQDQVPSFNGELAKDIIERTFKKNIADIFAHFETVPLASASIAQVHAATLKNGQSVVVKIVRPGIEKIIRRDVGLLYLIAALTKKFLPYGERLRPQEVVAEFERTIIHELDLLHEGANASYLRRNFLASPLLYIPEVFWDYSSHNILVMERISGIPISDILTLKSQGVNLKKLAERGVEIFFTQVLRDSFFHADMHPGNIFVSRENTIDPQYIAVDFGIVGTLSPIDQRYLAENLLAFFKRDYRRVAELHIESGWIDSNVRVDEFETAIRSVSEPIFQKPLKDISIGRLLLKLFQAAREFNMKVQPQFLLLQKTLLNIEGLGRQLYPELDLWATAKPYIEKWVKVQMGPRAVINRIYERSPLWMDKLLDMPDLMHQALTTQIKSYALQTQSWQITSETKKIRHKKWAGFGAGLMTAALLFTLVMPLTPLDYRLFTNIAVLALGLLLIIINI